MTGLLPVLPARAETPAQFRAAVSQIAYADPGTGKSVPILLLYPTRDPVQPIRRGPYHLNVAPEGGPALNSMPLVMMTQGPSRNGLAMVSVALFLARRGMMTAIVTHLGGMEPDADSRAGKGDRIGTVPLWPELPLQLRAALDAVLDSSPMGFRVDRQRIGVLGYAAGGHAALAAAGGVADPGRLAQVCAAHPDNRSLCPAGAKTTVAATPKRLEAATDSRIRSLLLMDPVGALFGDGALSRVTVPIRLYEAEKGDERGALQVARVRGLLPRPPEYDLVPGAGHYAFLTPVPASAAARFGATVQDPPGFDRAAFHARLNDEVLDYFRRTLNAAP
ncbi:hypothetical protein D9623_32115 [Azospirillum brasilense]|uniref:Dienelactone hydrolase n=1 Tax=Azospirillum brasilense TaxID=192 RepID=A0A0P0FFJ5_AZOBR|nr:MULTISPECIES: hypothetical protein [Azospirillum]ALJ39048.1 hypothetical protein AMK58_26560 [Azospirillum brasilense]MDW7557945.1 hypothetical protein [Azospirillum brasilense]MDW7596239.1 hypothetical protein [Azospirillum brasilense]MDW7628391.1 hypothetical protein [Azospirillum brasilense]MDX5950536.1 hypothetical protein [Azospirillum brasilense]